MVNHNEILRQVVKLVVVGGVIGLATSICTVLMIRFVANRTRYYKPNFMPMTLAERKLWQCAFVAYPVVSAIVFVALYFLKVIR